MPDLTDIEREWLCTCDDHDLAPFEWCALRQRGEAVEKIVAGRVRAALAPIQALADKWEDEARDAVSRDLYGGVGAYVSALRYAAHDLRLRAALAAAGVDAAPNETTTEDPGAAVEAVVNALYPTETLHERPAIPGDIRLQTALRAIRAYRAAVPSGHEQEGDDR